MECAFGTTVHLSTVSLSYVEESPLAGELFQHHLYTVPHYATESPACLYGCSHCEEVSTIVLSQKMTADAARVIISFQIFQVQIN